jgi:Carboxypeptidase regulatory-like domain
MVLNVAIALLLVAVPRASSATQPQRASPQQRTAPPRDAGEKDKTGTGVIRGRVVAAVSGRPLRRARITVSSPELGQDSRTTSTDVSGRYEVKDLPAARYRVSVSRGGYLSLNYGQRRPGEQGRPVQLADGQVIERIDFILPRMSMITGRVTDETGEPIEGVSVYAMRMLYFDGRRKFVPIKPATTDDVGEYRILKLPPGTYVVMASTHETWKEMESGKETVLGYMPTYFPGVANGAEARRVTLGVGQEAGATDFALIPGHAARVSGLALDSERRPFSRVNLSTEVRGLDFGSFGVGQSAAVAGDGTFTIAEVPPGEYMLSAVRMADDPSGEPEVALAAIVVEGNDLENIVLNGSTGGTVSGRIVVDGEAAPKLSAIRIFISEGFRGQPSPTVLGAFRNGGLATIKDDRTFSMSHAFGHARFRVTLPDGWMLKSVLYNGKNIADADLNLKSGEELNGVEVIITNRVTSVSGRLTDEKQEPLRDATVLVFPTDSSKWFESSRAMRAVRPDQQGQWQIKGLPAGDYLAIALDYVEDAAWIDPEYLESLRRYAEPVTLGEGASQVVTLKLATPKM